MFDWTEEIDELRTHSLEWLREARESAVRAQRQWRMRELAIVRVLDERGAADDSLAATDGISVRDARAAVETARALESLPHVAAAAAAGRLSDEQLAAVVRLADTDTDAEWAEMGPRCAPTELRREVRARHVPTVEESRRRHAARGLWSRYDERAGLWHGGFDLPDVEGAALMAVLEARAEQMRPPKGEAWAPLRHRLVDALVETVTGTGPERPPINAHLLINVPVTGPAEVHGVPIAHERLEQLVANASIEASFVDEHGTVVGMARARTLLSSRVVRAVKTHDAQCRWPGCTTTNGLEVHHLVPRSWGGTDDLNNLASVCPRHHRQLVPHGPFALIGAPRRVGGLDLVSADDLLADLDRPVGAGNGSGGATRSKPSNEAGSGAGSGARSRAGPSG